MAAADAAGEPVLLVGGGSNLVVGDDGWPGVVILVASDGIDASDYGGSAVAHRAPAWSGTSWSAQPSPTGWSGLAADVRHSRAGRSDAGAERRRLRQPEVADEITGLRVYDRDDRARSRTGARSAAEFGFRTCALQTHRPLRGAGGDLPCCRRRRVAPPVRYARARPAAGHRDRPDARRRRECASACWNCAAARACCSTRPITTRWSVGSFFVNPFAARDAVPARLPALADRRPDEAVGGLADRAGRLTPARAGSGAGNRSVSTKHSLALTNRGGATTAELLELAARSATASRRGSASG